MYEICRCSAMEWTPYKFFLLHSSLYIMRLSVSRQYRQLELEQPQLSFCRPFPQSSTLTICSRLNNSKEKQKLQKCALGNSLPPCLCGARWLPSSVLLTHRRATLSCICWYQLIDSPFSHEHFVSLCFKSKDCCHGWRDKPRNAGRSRQGTRTKILCDKNHC